MPRTALPCPARAQNRLSLACMTVCLLHSQVTLTYRSLIAKHTQTEMLAVVRSNLQVYIVLVATVGFATCNPVCFVQSGPEAFTWSLTSLSVLNGLCAGHNGSDVATWLRNHLHGVLVSDEDFDMSPVNAIRNAFIESDRLICGTIVTPTLCRPVPPTPRSAVQTEPPVQLCC